MRASDVRAHAAEIGRAGFIASGTLAVVGAVIEYHLRPGMFFSYVAPQHLAAIIAVFGALSLLEDKARPRRLPSTALLAFVGTASAFAAFLTARSFFDSVGIQGYRLALACAVAALLPFFLFRRFGGADRD
jgi:hypothetical protein